MVRHIISTKIYIGLNQEIGSKSEKNDVDSMYLHRGPKTKLRQLPFNYVSTNVKWPSSYNTMNIINTINHELKRNVALLYTCTFWCPCNNRNNVLDTTSNDPFQKTEWANFLSFLKICCGRTMPVTYVIYGSFVDFFF